MIDIIVHRFLVFVKRIDFLDDPCAPVKPPVEKLLLEHALGGPNIISFLSHCHTSSGVVE